MCICNAMTLWKLVFRWLCCWISFSSFRDLILFLWTLTLMDRDDCCEWRLLIWVTSKITPWEFQRAPTVRSPLLNHFQTCVLLQIDYSSYFQLSMLLVKQKCQMNMMWSMHGQSVTSAILNQCFSSYGHALGFLVWALFSREAYRYSWRFSIFIFLKSL